MKPLHWVLISAVILIVIVLIYQSNKNKAAAQQAATYAALSSQYPGGALAPGGSSGVAQIISSLFPYFNTAVVNSGNGGTKGSVVTPEYLPPKTITLT